MAKINYYSINESTFSRDLRRLFILPFSETVQRVINRNNKKLHRGPLSFPQNIHIEVTNNCNLRCPMCVFQHQLKKKGFMKFETFKKIIKQCPGQFPFNQIELARLYREVVVFVLSSDEEGLGIVILEAMASGLPVVSTDCGGPGTAIVEGKTGFLTPVGDADALAEAMQRFLDDSSLCQHMGRAGRRVAGEQFSLAVTGKVYLDHYDRLLPQSYQREVKWRFS